MDPSVKAPPPLTGEVFFSNSLGFMAAPGSLHVEKEALPITFPRSGSAETFAGLATALKSAESGAQAYSGGSLKPRALLPLVAREEGQNAGPGHPLSWLCIEERKPPTVKRRCHTWYLTLKGEGIELSFEHGELGSRMEHTDRWSSAFLRLSELLSGACSWQDFGDTESRNTLLGKGQFFWQAPASVELVPVDNFVFVLTGGRALALHGMGSSSCVLVFASPEKPSRWEQYENYAEGLLRMADLLEGAVALDVFGRDARPGLYLNATGRQESPALGAPALASQGQFCVRSIYRDCDELPAPVLAYRTREGFRLDLVTPPGGCQVQLSDAQRPARVRSYPAEGLPDAVRDLARGLRGTLLWEDF